MSAKNISVFVLVMFLVFGTTAGAHNIFVEIPLQADSGAECAFKSFFSHPYEPIEERDIKRDMTTMEMEVRLPGGTVEDVEMEQHDTYYETQWDFTEEGEHVFILKIVPVSTADELAESGDLEFKIMLGEEKLSDTELIVHQSFEPGGRLYDYDHDKPGIEPEEDGTFKPDLDRDYNYILEADHEISSSEVEDMFDYDTGLMTRNVRFRSTLYLPAK